jgi:peptidoglycan/xylan/chitin deacetylase (PgdA/CDA1 family)
MFQPGTKPKFLLTFDDGYKDLLNIRDIVKKYNINPVVFVIPNSGKPDYKELGQEYTRLTSEDLKLLQKEGWTIGSHTMTHADLTTLNTEQLAYEVANSKVELEKELGQQVNYFAYPKGSYNDIVLDAVKRAGYTYAFTMDDDTITTSTDPFKMPRVGVDRTHTFSAFKATYSPSNIKFRKLIKGLGIKGL